MLTEEQLKLYRHPKWREFNHRVFERDGYKCVRCGRSGNDVVLQAHHLQYIPDKKPWEYPLVFLETLCKGCHAKEHGEIPPDSGWSYEGESDLEDLCGECEYCGNEIRYEHLIYHPKWGYMTVGCACCDKLTNTDEASIRRREKMLYLGKLNRFITSKRWYNLTENIWAIKYKSNTICLTKYDDRFLISIEYNLHKSTKALSSEVVILRDLVINTLDDAKAKAFDAVQKLNQKGITSFPVLEIENYQISIYKEKETFKMKIGYDLIHFAKSSTTKIGWQTGRQNYETIEDAQKQYLTILSNRAFPQWIETHL